LLGVMRRVVSGAGMIILLLKIFVSVYYTMFIYGKTLFKFFI
jgi:hypothetical protein